MGSAALSGTAFSVWIGGDSVEDACALGAVFARGGRGFADVGRPGLRGALTAEASSDAVASSLPPGKGLTFWDLAVGGDSPEASAFGPFFFGAWAINFLRIP
ncbi:hypothetical protein GCM10017620_31780 [Brevundimonas intermedia]|uniref:Uncharacterized protein n=1 Tax=Brevundimonas intermedia TaxID=74315 RepID=A0ABQ5TE09_9CAUL|nr:hypothetical protein GCM10017620_31780 [Brevundimonas intermedia]